MNNLFIIRITTLVYFGFLVTVVVSVTNGWFQDVFDFASIYVGDKWSHFVLVGMLAFLLNLSLKSTRWPIGRFKIQAGSLCLAVFATLEEFSQLLFSNRSFDLLDMSCNLLGIMAFGWLAWQVSGRLGIRSETLARMAT